MNKIITKHGQWVPFLVSIIGLLYSIISNSKINTDARWLLATILLGTVAIIIEYGASKMSQKIQEIILFARLYPALSLFFISFDCFFFGILIFLCEFSQKTEIMQRPIEFALIAAGTLLLCGSVLMFASKPINKILDQFLS